MKTYISFDEEIKSGSVMKTNYKNVFIFEDKIGFILFTRINNQEKNYEEFERMPMQFHINSYANRYGLE